MANHPHDQVCVDQNAIKSTPILFNDWKIDLISGVLSWPQSIDHSSMVHPIRSNSFVHQWLFEDGGTCIVEVSDIDPAFVAAYLTTQKRNPQMTVRASVFFRFLGCVGVPENYFPSIGNEIRVNSKGTLK